MIRRLREIPCRMLAHTAVKLRVLVALIQCATMANEVVEVATESEQEVVINGVAIFYEKGKEGKIFRKKNRGRYYSGPPCTCGFGIREKIRCMLRIFGVFLCGFAVLGPPLRPLKKSLKYFPFLELSLQIS